MDTFKNIEEQNKIIQECTRIRSKDHLSETYLIDPLEKQLTDIIKLQESITHFLQEQFNEKIKSGDKKEAEKFLIQWLKSDSSNNKTWDLLMKC